MPKYLSGCTVDVSQLVDQLLPTPAVCRLNPVIGKLLKNIYSLLTLSKIRKQRKRGGELSNFQKKHCSGIGSYRCTNLCHNDCPYFLSIRWNRQNMFHCKLGGIRSGDLKWWKWPLYLLKKWATNVALKFNILQPQTLISIDSSLSAFLVFSGSSPASFSFIFGLSQQTLKFIITT